MYILVGVEGISSTCKRSWEDNWMYTTLLAKFVLSNLYIRIEFFLAAARSANDLAMMQFFLWQILKSKQMIQRF